MRIAKEAIYMGNTIGAGNQPEKKFSTGAICATIWKNNGTNRKTGEPVEYRTIQLDRRYKDKKGIGKALVL